MLRPSPPVEHCRVTPTPHRLSVVTEPHPNTPLSSTNLDSWSLQQLRTLKVGGNGALAEFFQKRGGANLLPPGNSDARARYTSRVAGLYKEELARRVAEDAQAYPHGIHIEGLDLTPMGTRSSTPAQNDDFFESWDKAAPTPSPRPSKPASPAPPPSIGVARASATPSPKPTSPTTAAPQPRTLSSSALRTGAASGGAAAARPMRLGKPSKLGAKKASTSINFEEAQRKAAEEEERIKRLGYDKKKEEEEAAALKAREEEERRKNQASGVNNSRSATPLSQTRKEEKPVPVKLGFGQVASNAPPPSTSKA